MPPSVNAAICSYGCGVLVGDSGALEAMDIAVDPYPDAGMPDGIGRVHHARLPPDHLRAGRSREDRVHGYAPVGIFERCRLDGAGERALARVIGA